MPSPAQKRSRPKRGKPKDPGRHLAQTTISTEADELLKARAEEEAISASAVLRRALYIYLGIMPAKEDKPHAT